MISQIAGGDLIKIQELYKLPIRAVLNHLAYKLVSKT